MDIDDIRTYLTIHRKYTNDTSVTDILKLSLVDRELAIEFADALGNQSAKTILSLNCIDTIATSWVMRMHCGELLQFYKEDAYRLLKNADQSAMLLHFRTCSDAFNNLTHEQVISFFKHRAGTHAWHWTFILNNRDLLIKCFNAYGNKFVLTKSILTAYHTNVLTEYERNTIEFLLENDMLELSSKKSYDIVCLWFYEYAKTQPWYHEVFKRSYQLYRGTYHKLYGVLPEFTYEELQNDYYS